MKTFKFHTKYGGKCDEAYLNQSTYMNNGAIHLSVFDANTGEQLCVATTNVPGYRPKPGYVLIKDWSENAGVYRALVDAGVIEAFSDTVGAGFATAYLCRYLWGEK